MANRYTRIFDAGGLSHVLSVLLLIAGAEQELLKWDNPKGTEAGAVLPLSSSDFLLVCSDATFCL